MKTGQSKTTVPISKYRIFTDMKSQTRYRVPVPTGLLFLQTWQFTWHWWMWRHTASVFCSWDSHQAETAHWEVETTKTLAGLYHARHLVLTLGGTCRKWNTADYVSSCAACNKQCAPSVLTRSHIEKPNGKDVYCSCWYMDSAGRQLSLQSVHTARSGHVKGKRPTHTWKSYRLRHYINLSSGFDRAPVVLFAPSATIHTIGPHVA